MKLSKKPTCDGRGGRCTALRFHPTRCTLGYLMRWVPDDYNWIPTEPCPKPMTPAEFAACKRKGET